MTKLFACTHSLHKSIMKPPPKQSQFNVETALETKVDIPAHVVAAHVGRDWTEACTGQASNGHAQATGHTHRSSSQSQTLNDGTSSTLHSIPIKQAVSWLRSHDKEARAIAEAGREFALTHLNRDSRLCYWKLLIEEYGKLFM